MRVLYRTLVLSTLVVAAAACGKKDNRDAFRGTDDMLLQNGAGAVASPTELGLRDSVPAALAPQAQPTRAPQRVASRSTSHRSTSRASRRGTYSSGSGVYTPPAPVRVKHTKRDAAVGAAAGAVIGATVDRSHRVRGAVVGGVVGGILGGVLGNNVDITKK